MNLSWRKVVHFLRFTAFKNQNRQGESYTTFLNLLHILYCDPSNVHFIFVKSELEILHFCQDNCI